MWNKGKEDLIHVMEMSWETRGGTSLGVVCRCARWLWMSSKEMHNLEVCVLSKLPQDKKWLKKQISLPVHLFKLVK